MNDELNKKIEYCKYLIATDLYYLLDIVRGKEVSSHKKQIDYYLGSLVQEFEQLINLEERKK